MGTPHNLGGLGVGGDMGFKGARDRYGDDGVERNVGDPVPRSPACPGRRSKGPRAHVGLEPRQSFRDIREGVELLNLRRR